MIDAKTSVPNPHDDPLPVPEVLPATVANTTMGTMDMAKYKLTVPFWKRVWQHSLTQMALLSVQAFCGPAMADAIAGECNP
jgi:hypothetical protein